MSPCDQAGGDVGLHRGRGPFRRHVRDALVGALVIEVLLFAGTEAAIHSLPEGEVYRLAPRGKGLLLEVLLAGVVMTLFSLVYTLPSFMARPWIGGCYRFVMFLMFTVGFTCVRTDKFLAAVRSEGQWTFVRPYPLSAWRIHGEYIRSVELRETQVVRTLRIARDHNEWVSVPVYRADEQGTADLLRLAVELRQQARR